MMSDDMRQIGNSIRADVVLAKGKIYAGFGGRITTISNETEALYGNLGPDCLAM
jgi:hypothetical protein